MRKILNRTQLLSVGAAVAALAALAAPHTASAGTATSTLGVSATVSANCSVTTTAVAFGTYTGAVNNAQGAINVTCTDTTPYNIKLDQGGATGATVTTRAMTGGGSTLNYALYSNAGMTTNWGQTIGTDTVTGTGSGVQQVVTVYGQIAANQNVPPNSYADTVNVTVAY
jgi:spore coat protein U-like protein